MHKVGLMHKRWLMLVSRFLVAVSTYARSFYGFVKDPCCTVFVCEKIKPNFMLREIFSISFKHLRKLFVAKGWFRFLR